MMKKLMMMCVAAMGVMSALAAIELQSVSLPSTLNVPQVALPHAERDRFDLSTTRALWPRFTTL